MRSSRSLPSLMLALALSGCASAPEPEPPAIDPFEQNLLDAFAAGADYLVPGAIAASRSRYESVDDLAGQWRITRLAALHALASGDSETARDEAGRLGALRDSINQAETLGLRVGYETDIIIGRAFDTDAPFRRLARESASGIDRAVALTYLGQTSAAVQAAGEGSDRPADRAFVHYRHGAASGSASDLRRALALYRAVGDGRGVADSLFALARIAAADGDRDKARTYAGRAQRALLAIGDPERAEAVATWLSRQ